MDVGIPTRRNATTMVIAIPVRNVLMVCARTVAVGAATVLAAKRGSFVAEMRCAVTRPTCVAGVLMEVGVYIITAVVLA
jgi:hypothetical protein